MKEQEKWRQQVGPDEYQNFQRLLLIDAMDREWRDYLTAMDDLRREIGLAAIGQRDPKVEYKRRSFEMFADMRNNISRDIVNRFFRQVAGHQAFIQQQEAAVAYQLQAQDAGYQVVRRKEGRGTELRRDMPKVGRNEPCPCGSGKKYKQCHGRQAGLSAAGSSNGHKVPASQPAHGSKGSGKKRRRR
jgi:preprotein translocase subunit SecA